MYRHSFAWIAVVRERWELLARCDQCGMNISAGRLLKHQRMKRYDWNMQIWWQRRDVAIASRCEKAMFILIGEEYVECIEGVESFKYMVKILDWLDNNWPAALWNIGKARRVCNRLGKLIRREGG